MDERTIKTIFTMTLTETQKEALFAFGEKGKAATGCNLMIAAGMCEGDMTKAILLHLADLIDTSSLAEALLCAAAIPEEGDEPSGTPGKSTDEVLAALVNSDFDLKTLDEWDKIKSS